MNPEDNNPLSVPGVPGADMTSAPGMGGLSATDNLASAADNLTSAGLAVGGNDGIMGLDQLGSVRPEAIMAPPEEEPLVPAAPVPGSIGSAMSVPPSQNPADAIPPVPPMAAAPAPGTAPSAEPTPTVSAPYNPFATPAQPAASPAAAQSETPSGVPPLPNPTPMPTASTDPAAPFQPMVPPKAKPALLTIILGIASGILAITTIIFLILFINANNNPRIVYKPDNNTSTSLVEVMTCSRDDDLGWLIGEGYSAPGVSSIELSYTNNLLRGLSSTHTAQFASEVDAETAKANFEANQAELMNAISGSFAAENQTVNGLLTATVSSNNESFNPTDAATYMYGLGNNLMSTSLDIVRETYENAGYSCNTSK